MTTRPGRRARWTTALIAFPGAAAIFGVSMAWAEHSAPATAGRATSSQTTPDGPDPAISALLQAVSSGSAAIDQARAQLASLQNLAAPGVPATASATAAAAGRTTSAPVAHTTAAAASPRGTAAAVAPAPKPPVTRSSTPPPVQVTTGASGAPK